MRLIAITALSIFAFTATVPSVPAWSAPKTAAKKSAQLKASPGNTLVTLHTSRGPIVMELYSKVTPLTAGNFIKLSKKGFYNGQTFHRVVPGFVIQAGDPYSKNSKDPQAQMRVGTGGPGYTIKREKSALQFKHNPGAVAMARTADPDSAGSQFYIVLGEPHHLDGEYAIFGKVVRGMDVARKIEQNDKINKVTVGK